MGQSIISDWQEDHAAKFSQEDLRLHHRLKDTGLFSLESLSELIDKCPSTHYNLNTMGYDPENPLWREGIVRKSSGKEVIDSLTKGRIWLNMRGVEEIDSRYKALLDDIFSEFESYVPGFSTFKTRMGILISSPMVQVFYHADIPGQSLWQLEGEKRVFVYPTGDPYMSQKSMEGIILGETEEDIPFHSDFDKAARVYDLKAGEMLHWPLNCPHRIENKNCLNISVTTEHYTNDIRKSYAVNFANGILRRKFGMNSLSPSITSPSAYPKAAMALMWKKLNLGKGSQFKSMIDFTIDPLSESGIVDIPAFAKANA